jgi:hypothetical protein
MSATAHVPGSQLACRLQEELDASRGGRPVSPAPGASRRQSSLAGPHHGRPSMMVEPHGRPSFLPAALGDAGSGAALSACFVMLCQTRVFTSRIGDCDESLRSAI